jgi:hypothetical protein
MPDIRPTASLTSSLLARRGDARPAMRRQPIAHLHVPLAPQEDLGWNDIGDDYSDPVPQAASLAAITPVGLVSSQGDAGASAGAEASSPLTHQLETITRRLTTAPIAKTVKPKVERKSAAKHAPLIAEATSRKAAFTLRIDTERHLRLRLLSALTNRSSQQLLIEALDALLAGHGDLEGIAGQAETVARGRGAGTKLQS